MKKLFLWAVLGAALCLTFSCKEEVPQFFGNYNLHVTARDTVGEELTNGLDGFKITIEGRGDPIVLYSDQNGEALLENIEWGQYLVSVGKEGFTPVDSIQFPFFGKENETFDRILPTTFQLSRYKIKNFNLLLTQETSGSWLFEVPDEVFNQILEFQTMYIFFSEDPEVSFNNFAAYRTVTNLPHSQRHPFSLFKQDIPGPDCYAVAYLTATAYGSSSSPYLDSFLPGTSSDIVKLNLNLQ